MDKDIMNIVNNNIDDMIIKVGILKLKLKYDIERMIMVKTGKTK